MLQYSRYSNSHPTASISSPWIHDLHRGERPEPAKELRELLLRQLGAEVAQVQVGGARVAAHVGHEVGEAPPGGDVHQGLAGDGGSSSLQGEIF